MTMRHLSVVALSAFVFCGFAQPADAQRTDTLVVIQAISPVKDPGLATLIGVLIPGGGQFYTDRPNKGAVLLVLGYGAPVAGLFSSTWVDDPKTGARLWNFTPLYTGLAVGVGAWAYGWATASGDATEHNSRLPRRTVTVMPSVERTESGARFGLVAVLR